MSVTSPANSVDFQSRRPGLSLQLLDPSTAAQRSDGHDILGVTTPRPGIARHYTSLKEHADAVYSATWTPGGGQGSSPRAEDRREGFTWESIKNEEPRISTPFPLLPPTPRTPPTLEELSRSSSVGDVSGDARTGVPKVESLSRTSTKEFPQSSPLTGAPSRTDTNRSSISGMARGMMRRVPDMRMFHPAEKKIDGDEQESCSKERAESKDERHAQFAWGAARPKVQFQESTSARSDMVVPTPSMSSKMTLKDRRLLGGQNEAMKLTLPIGLPDLPSRNRPPVSDISSIVPSRPRSPKTPWIMDKPPEWLTTDAKKAPATILEDEEPTSVAKDNAPTPSQTPRSEKPEARNSKGRLFGRIRWSNSRRSLKTSESNPPSENQRISNDELYSPAIPSPETEAKQVLKDLGARSRSRRFRWSSSNDLDVTPPAERPSSPFTPFSITRLIKPKRSGQQLRATSPLLKGDKSYWRHKQSMAAPDFEVIDNMTVPPSFVPPGLSRVPTPPMFDASGEVKGQLADFFFDLQGVRTHKPPPAAGGVWDSDALLMSQDSGLRPPSSGSDESPQGPVPDTPPDLPKNSFQPTITTPRGGTYIESTPPYHLADANFFRAGADPATRGAEEIAKLEWLIPEHLPNSPLCPLHEKYKGPSKGLCVYHIKKRSLSEGRTRRQSGQRGRRESGYRDYRRDSGLARTASTAFDGSEDADESEAPRTIVVSSPRKRRRWFRVSIA